MAPRTPESREQFLARLREQAAAGAREVRFGQHHFTHAACLEQGVWRVRKLELDEGDAERYMAEHGHFMPENAEELSKPGAIVMEAETLGELEGLLEREAWPL